MRSAFDFARRHPRAVERLAHRHGVPILAVHAPCLAVTQRVWGADPVHRLRRTVEVAGDFSAWQPIELRRAGGGWWETELRVSAGTHEISVRVDGSAWDAPPGRAVIVDELGGRTGLLVVP